MPSRLYNGYSLVDLGEVEESQYVRLYDGVKSPVFRIHPRVGHNDTTMSDFPTFTMEVGFTSNKRQLLENAARYVCMSQGRVNVAATLELDLREVAGNGVVLRKAVWSHWRFERKEQDMVAGLPAHTVFEQVPLAETRGSRLEFRGVFIDQTTSRYIAVEDEVFQASRLASEPV